MDIKKLRHFVEIAQTGTFSEASEKLHISQPALTRSIQSLESSLDVTLFDRSQRQIKLTDTGRRLLVHAQKALMEVDNLAEQSQRLKKLQAGKLSIGIGPLPAEPVGAPASGLFMTRYPKVNLQMIVDDPIPLSNKLIDGELDLIIVDQRGLAEHPDIHFQPLPSVPAVTVARAGHPLAVQTDVSQNDLKQYPLASISQLAANIIAKALNVDPHDIFSFNCNSVSLMLETLKHCDAVGFLLEPHVTAGVASGDLVALNFSPISTKVTSQYGIGTYRPRLNSLATDAFIDILHELNQSTP